MLSDRLKTYEFFLDLDGVLVDFDKSKHRLKFRSDKEMWAEVDKTPHWFLTLDPMPDHMDLWNFLRHYQVTILTAIPKTAQKEHAAQDKRDWVMNYIQPDVHIITCFGAEKQNYAHPKGILIDDTGRNIGQWMNKGGIGILHRDARTTIDILKEMK
jgi:5'(3')-deoxyribonucleotidase